METGANVVLLCLLALVSINTATNGPGRRMAPRVRLVGGERESEGRVEVYLNGQWGTVCDDGPAFTFDTDAARVVCRELGYNSTQVYVLRNSDYGVSDSPILMSDVECEGYETSILQCRHDSVGRVSVFCEHSHDVGVDCALSALRVRLAGGERESEGRVELFHDGQWGTVCDRSFTFDINAARVVCRELGYNSTQVYVQHDPKYGESDGLILLAYVSCRGDETSILQCEHRGLGRTSVFCDHSHDVGVDCAAKATAPRLRLVGGERESEGRVELYLNGQWGTVCDEGPPFTFDTNAARVVCRELGYNSNQAYAVNGDYYGENDGPILLSDVRCGGDETSILQCRHESIGRVSALCGHWYDAGVDCVPKAPRVRLVGGERESEGLMELYLNGQWGTVCEGPTYTFDTKAARIVCRELGYNSTWTNVVNGDHYGESDVDGPILLSDVVCEGDETSILQCKHDGLGRASVECDHLEDVGVDCAPSESPVRLVGGERESEGLVELFHGGHWGTVCDRSFTFDTNAARVVCRELGYNSNRTNVLTGTQYGENDGPILLSDVRCGGDETSILQCNHNGLERVSVSCDHSHNIGVDCAPSAPRVRLVGGERGSEGRVELFLNGQWGTVCDEGPPFTFDTEAARVVCRELGYNSNLSDVMPHAYFGAGDGPILLHKVNCRGDEASILLCAHSGLGRVHGRCNHSRDVSVVCASQAPKILAVAINHKESTNLDSALHQTVVLTCRARGWPAPSVRVYREDTGQQMELRNTSVNSQDVLQSHTVTSYTRCQDAAVYTCEASNGAGNASRSARLYIDCAPRLSEGNNTDGSGTEDKPFRVRRDQAEDFVFHIVAYPAPHSQKTLFLGDTVPPNASLSDLVSEEESMRDLVICTPSDVILYQARCVVARDLVDGGLYAVTLGNHEGDVTVFMQVDPRSPEETTPGPTGADIVPIVIYTAVGGALVLTIVLAVVFVLRLRRRYHERMRYRRAHYVPEKRFYTRLLRNLLRIPDDTELQEADEDYHSIDDAHILPEEPRLPSPVVCLRRKRVSLKPRFHHVPLPPLPTENLQGVTSRAPARRWSLPEDYLHPAVCRRLSQNTSDTASCQSKPFQYLDPPSLPVHPAVCLSQNASDTASCQSEPFVYLDPPSRPVHPAVTASDRHGNSVHDGCLNPTLTLAARTPALPHDYLHPSAVLSGRRRLSLPSDYLRPVAAPSEACPPAMSDKVSSNSLPEDYLHPLQAVAKTQTSTSPNA